VLQAQLDLRVILDLQARQVLKALRATQDLLALLVRLDLLAHKGFKVSKGCKVILAQLDLRV
jgi:hypothetical protein